MPGPRNLSSVITSFLECSLRVLRRFFTESIGNFLVFPTRLLTYPTKTNVSEFGLLNETTRTE
jgi:hypothetical protein